MLEEESASDHPAVGDMPALLAWGCVAGLPVGAAEPAAKPQPDFSAELPRIPAKSPAEALDTFRVLPGFKIEQVAAEPLVHDPVAVSFDENGRLYVVEMIDYSEQANDFLGTIRILEDTDADGRFDKSTVFIEKLSWPTAITCYDGGVFIGAAPISGTARTPTGTGSRMSKRKCSRLSAVERAGAD